MDNRCALCGYAVNEDLLVEVYWIPEWLRETARAARTTRGVMQRIHVCCDCLDADAANSDLEDGGLRMVK